MYIRRSLYSVYWLHCTWCAVVFKRWWISKWRESSTAEFVQEEKYEGINVHCKANNIHKGNILCCYLHVQCTLIKNMTHFLIKSGVLLHVLYAQCTKYAFVPPATCINTVPSTSKQWDLRKSWKKLLAGLGWVPCKSRPRACQMFTTQELYRLCASPAVQHY